MASLNLKWKTLEKRGLWRQLLPLPRSPTSMEWSPNHPHPKTLGRKPRVKISRIEVNNFRSLKSIDIEVPQICALVGPNNSGKSNIMAAIEGVLGSRWLTVNSFEEEDVFGQDPNADINIQITFDPPLIYKKYVADTGVRISTFSFEFTRYKRGEEKGERRLEQKCYEPSGRAKCPIEGTKERRTTAILAPCERSLRASRIRSTNIHRHITGD